ncbi:MAG: hypothetical protein ACRETN_01830 [Nevskiales bacterium]
MGAVPAPISACDALYQELDQATERSGVRDGGEQPIAGFPHLRVNRLLASLTPQAADEKKFDAWISRLAALDLNAREIELHNLAGTDATQVLQRLRECSAEKLARNRADPERHAQLIDAAQVPADYSNAARFFGLYPLAVPFLRAGIEKYNREVRTDFARPLRELPHGGRLILWRPDAVAAPKPIEVARWLQQRDVLGMPQLTAAQWQKLAVAHAPSWWVETEGDYDLPGAPVWRGQQAALDTSQPVTYFLPSYGRWQGRVVPQLVYVVWFAARPPESSLDFYAGQFDGLVWRVTLDETGQPLAYDTIHPCGCYHYYFPVADLKVKVKDSMWQEPVLVPQVNAPAKEVAVRVESATHYVRRVVPDYAAFSTERRQYTLRPYRELLSLPRSDGTRRSLFRPNGLLCGSERLERLWLWPSGVISPGAMRQWGRHATAFVGTRHFDDPEVMERVFAPAR